MMEIPTKTDVIIIGAGPTGLSLAVQLRRYGIDFVIVDQKAGVTDLSKALVVHARTLEIYDQVGLAQAAVANGAIVQHGALMHDGNISARLDFSGFGGHLSPFPFLLIFEQSKNEHLLYEHLQRHGKEVHWQTVLENLEQSADKVRAIVRTAEGDRQTIEARYLIGCDGASSPTRHLLNLNFDGSTNPRQFYVADVEMDFQAEAATFYAALGHNAFVLIVPMQGGQHWRLIGNMPEYDDRGDDAVTFAAIETKVQELLQRSLNIKTVRWFSSYKVHTRHVENFSRGRCFLAGDAAHVHTPAGGQGMNTGIQDAYNLAWKIAFVLRGVAPDALLDTYNEERLANAKRLLQSTDQFFDVAASDQWYFQFMRDHLLPTVANWVMRFGAAREFIFQLVSEIGINYRDRSLSQHRGDHPFKVKAGDRLPYFQVNGQSVYDQLGAPRFHLITFVDRQSDDRLKSDLETNYGGAIDFTVIPLSPHIGEIFGTRHPFQVLLRPDNYIGLITTDLSLQAVNAYWQQLMQPSIHNAVV